ncbi:hypothetical protein AAC387_Pa04g1212 [Persea americana]
MLQKFKNTYEITRFHKPIVFLKQSRNFHVNVSYTNYSSLLRDAIKTKSLAKTQEIHAQTLIHGLFAGTHIANLTMESYFKCGESKLAHQVFEQMPERDSMSWTHVVSSYSQNKQSEKAIRFFRLMNQQGCDPNRASLISALSSCGHISKSIQGKQLHSQVVRRIPPSDVTVCNVLIDFYSRCGELSEAWLMFDETLDKDLVSWTTMLSGYSQNGLSREALDFFILMHSQDMGFSQYAFSVTAKACGELRNSKAGEELHCLVIKTGFESQVFVASALLDMYSKQGKTTFVRKVFELMDEPNVVSWTSIITAYVQIDKGEEALDLFKHQLQVGVQPDAFSLSSILAACANIPALEFGKQIHSHIIKSGFEFQIFAGNSLVGMYSKCGCLYDAQKMHKSMQVRDVITWTSMIAGFAQHGHGVEALMIFDQMKETNIKPNSITFIAVLSACSRSGLVDEGFMHFQSMSADYGIESQEEHYTCMVDLLARAGRVKEAEGFMRAMPFEPSASSWGALLSGCRACGELALGLKCAEQLFRLEPELTSNHILLANMYAAVGRWEEMGRIRGLMKEKGLKKESGYSWIEVGKEVSVFGVGDNLHPLRDLIYAMLQNLSLEMEPKVKSRYFS